MSGRAIRVPRAGFAIDSTVSLRNGRFVGGLAVAIVLAGAVMLVAGLVVLGFGGDPPTRHALSVDVRREPGA